MESNEVKKTAREFRIDQWIDPMGQPTAPILMEHYSGKFKIIFCFQHWCAGCHSLGLPTLQKLVETFKNDSGIAFFAIQTVFEGEHENTFDKIIETQKKYDLQIPFGHDPGNGGSTLMEDYHTGGTPWFIFINQHDEVVFEGFHIDVEKAIDFLKAQLTIKET